MKRSKFSEAQVAMILRQADEGADLPPSGPAVIMGVRRLHS